MEIQTDNAPGQAIAPVSNTNVSKIANLKLAPRQTESGPADTPPATNIVVPIADDATSPSVASLQQPKKSGLFRFSLLGQADELAANAIKSTPLLGDVCLQGEATMWYAKPNAGKTLLGLKLLLDAIEAGRIEAARVVYVNMDDNSAGLAEKARILEDHGVAVIAPGYNDFTPAKLMPALDAMVEQNDVSGLLVILDTVKKLTDLMDKKRSSEFSSWARRFVQKGGTMLGLAHTNKRAGADGKGIYAGTSDIVDDFDCAYLLSVREEKTRAGHRIVEFTNIKRRGDAAERAVYSYDAGKGVTYYTRLASVEALHALDFEPLRYETRPDDGAIQNEIVKAIKGGTVQKMDLIAAVRAQLKVSKVKVIAVLDDWTGQIWTYDVKARGAHVYRFMEKPPAPEGEAG